MKEGELVKRSNAETRLVVARIADYYYDADPRPRKDASKFLETSGSDWEALNALDEGPQAADQFLKAGFGSPATPKTDGVERAIESAARRTITGLVVLAKCDALVRVGKRSEARELLLRHIEARASGDAEAEALVGLESPGVPRYKIGV
jgi:hypothetical protein